MNHHPNLARVTLPEPQAATAERLTASLTQLARDLVRGAMPSRNLAAALRQVADTIELESKDPPAGPTTLEPIGHPIMNAISDADMRGFRVDYVANDPRIAAVVITVASAKEFPFTLSIADMRRMGEEL